MILKSSFLMSVTAFLCPMMYSFRSHKEHFEGLLLHSLIIIPIKPFHFGVVNNCVRRAGIAHIPKLDKNLQRSPIRRHSRPVSVSEHKAESDHIKGSYNQLTSSYRNAVAEEGHEFQRSPFAAQMPAPTTFADAPISVALRKRRAEHHRYKDREVASGQSV